MPDFKAEISSYYEVLVEAIGKLNIDEIDIAMNALVDAYEREATIYVFGNGGSAATASHMVCDFNKGVSMNLKKKFHFHCLNDNIPLMMAVSNDLSYEDIFYFPLIGNVKKNDVILAISGSGNSKNIIKACEYAKSQGAIVIGISGYDGGKLYKLSDYNLHAPINDMMKSEDLHMVFDHMMMTIFKKYFEHR